MSRTKDVLFFSALAVTFGCGPLAAWGDHAGWGDLWVLVIVGALALSAGAVIVHLTGEEVTARTALRDENGDPVPFTDTERSLYEFLGLVPVETRKRQR